MAENTEAARKILLKRETVKAVRSEQMFFWKQRMKKLFFVVTIILAVSAVIWFFPRHEKVISMDASLENTNNVVKAIKNYFDFYGQYPPAFARDLMGEPTVSWRVLILPFFDEKDRKQFKLDELYREFDLQQRWDSEANRHLVKKMPQFYLSPQSENSLAEGKTNILTIRHPNSVFPGDRMVKEEDVSDQPSETVMIVEVGDRQSVPWSAPEDFVYDPDFPARATPAYIYPGGLVCGKCSWRASFETEPAAQPKLMRKARSAMRRNGEVFEVMPASVSPWLGFFFRNSDKILEEHDEEERAKLRLELVKRDVQVIEKPKSQTEDEVLMNRIKQTDYLRPTYQGLDMEELGESDDHDIIEDYKRRKREQELERLEAERQAARQKSQADEEEAAGQGETPKAGENLTVENVTAGESVPAKTPDGEPQTPESGNEPQTPEDEDGMESLESLY